MGFFNWSAPIFGHYADRWSDDDIAEMAEWLRPFVAPRGALLDVGGGTGALAHKLQAALDSRVVVLDPTPEMVRYLPAHSPVEVVLGRAEAMPFGDAMFDAIVVTDAFHHFREQRAAAAEFARVLRPGGGAVVLELAPHGLGMRVVSLVERLVGEPAAFLAPEELREMMAGAGLIGTSAVLGGGPSYRFVGRAEKAAPTPSEQSRRD